jgi:hypothetical protein
MDSMKNIALAQKFPFEKITDPINKEMIQLIVKISRQILSLPNNAELDNNTQKIIETIDTYDEGYQELYQLYANKIAEAQDNSLRHEFKKWMAALEALHKKYATRYSEGTLLFANLQKFNKRTPRELKEAKEKSLALNMEGYQHALKRKAFKQAKDFCDAIAIIEKAKAQGYYQELFKEILDAKSENVPLAEACYTSMNLMSEEQKLDDNNLHCKKLMAAYIEQLPENFNETVNFFFFHKSSIEKEEFLHNIQTIFQKGVKGSENVTENLIGCCEHAYKINSEIGIQLCTHALTLLEGDAKAENICLRVLNLDKAQGIKFFNRVFNIYLTGDRHRNAADFISKLAGIEDQEYLAGLQKIFDALLPHVKSNLNPVLEEVLGKIKQANVESAVKCYACYIAKLLEVRQPTLAETFCVELVNLDKAEGIKSYQQLGNCLLQMTLFPRAVQVAESIYALESKAAEDLSKNILEAFAEELKGNYDSEHIKVRALYQKNNPEAAKEYYISYIRKLYALGYAHVFDYLKRDSVNVDKNVIIEMMIEFFNTELEKDSVGGAVTALVYAQHLATIDSAKALVLFKRLIDGRLPPNKDYPQLVYEAIKAVLPIDKKCALDYFLKLYERAYRNDHRDLATSIQDNIKIQSPDLLQQIFYIQLTAEEKAFNLEDVQRTAAQVKEIYEENGKRLYLEIGEKLLVQHAIEVTHEQNLSINATFLNLATSIPEGLNIKLKEMEATAGIDFSEFIKGVNHAKVQKMFELYNARLTNLVETPDNINKIKELLSKFVEHHPLKIKTSLFGSPQIQYYFHLQPQRLVEELIECYKLTILACQKLNAYPGALNFFQEMGNNLDLKRANEILTALKEAQGQLPALTKETTKGKDPFSKENLTPQPKVNGETLPSAPEARLLEPSPHVHVLGNHSTNTAPSAPPAPVQAPASAASSAGNAAVAASAGGNAAVAAPSVYPALSGLGGPGINHHGSFVHGPLATEHKEEEPTNQSSKPVIHSSVVLT